MSTNSIIIAITSICFVAPFVRIMLRRRKNYEQYIEPELTKLGLTVRNIRTAPILNVGPFPVIDVKMRQSESMTPVGSGEFTEYRIVDAIDSEGQPVTVWCKLEFEFFQFRSIEIKSSEKRAKQAIQPTPGTVETEGVSSP